MNTASNKRDLKLTIKEIQQIETEILKEVHDICDKHNITYYLSGGSVLGAVRHQGPIPWDEDVDIVVPINEFDKFLRIVRENLSEKYFLFYYDESNHHTPMFARIGLKGYSSRILHLDVFYLVGAPEDKETQNMIKQKALKYQKLHFNKNIQFKMIDFSLKRKLYVTAIKFLTFFISSNYLESKHEEIRRIYPYDKSNYVANLCGSYGIKEFSEKSLYGKPVKILYDNYYFNAPEKTKEYLIHFYGDYMQLPPDESRKIKDFYIIHKL